MNVFDAELHVFRLYEDGTETGSTPRAAENTGANVTADSDAQFQLRIGIQEIGGANGQGTDDYRLQYNKNGGGWNDVTASSSNVKADTGSTLSDGSAATDRASQGINDGVQFFIAGEQEAGDGEVTDHQLKANEWTEHVFGLLIIAADVADTDTIDFRTSLNGGSPGMTITVTATVTIVKLGGNVIVEVPRADILTSGKVPVVLLPIVVAVAAAALTLTGQAVTLEETIPVGNASITATGQGVIAGLGPYTAEVGKADLVLTGQEPIIDIGEGGIIIGVDEANLTLTGQGVTLDENIPVGKVDLTVAGQGVTLDTGIDVGDASLVLAGRGVTLDFGIAVAKVDLTLAGQAPILSIVPSPVAPTNERSVAFHSISRSAVVHAPPRSVLVDSSSRSAVARSPSRSVKVDRRRVIAVASAQQFHEQHSIECFQGRMERTGGSLWGMGDNFTLALWIKFEGAQGALRSGVIDIRPAANDLSRINIHQKFLGTVLTFRIWDFLGNLRVDVDHTVTVASMEDQWNRVIFSKFRNVASVSTINGTSINSTGSFLTIDGTKNIAIADLVTGNSQNFRLRVGHVYMWNTFLDATALDDRMVAGKHGYDPLQGAGSGNIQHWYRPGEYGILCQDRVASLDLVGADGVDINDRKVDGP